MFGDTAIQTFRQEVTNAAGRQPTRHLLVLGEAERRMETGRVRRHDHFTVTGIKGTIEVPVTVSRFPEALDR